MKTTTPFPRPTVVVSRCLCGARCRWDGDASPNSFVRELKRYVRVIPVCPEMEIGLGVPRDRIVLVRRGKGVELYQPASKRRLAQKMNSFTRSFLTRCGEVDGFILKHKSPSCGRRGVKVYDSTAPDAAFVRDGVGLFAAEAIRLRPHAAFDDETRLDNPDLREHFLTRLFTLAAWRATRRRGSVASLKRFHEYHRLLLGVCNRRIAGEMDRFASGNARSERVVIHYETLLHRVLQKPPRRKSQIQPFALALEHYAPFLSASDCSRFRLQIEEYLASNRPLSDLRKTVQIWGVRYDKNFIRRHSFFRPYPGPLAEG